MIDRKSTKFLVLFSVLFISTYLPFIHHVAADPVGYEPNNNFANATLLTKGRHSDLSINSTDQVDYYKITLNAGENMSVVLWNITDWLDLALYDPSQNLLSSSYNMGTVNDSVILLPAPMTGDYYIKVFSYYMPMTISNYTLDITSIIDDALEENDNLALAPILIKQSYGNLYLADPDYYNISLTEGDNLTAQVTRTGGYGYFDLILIAPNGTEIQSMMHFSTSTLGNLVLRNALNTGLYCVIVNRTSGGWGNYSLLLADANDDIFEDNEGFATAALLTKGSIYGNLVLYDDDYYNVTLTANENISVQLTRYTGVGAFNMSLFSVDQTTELWYSNNIGSGHRVIAAHVPSSGAYTVRIRAVGNAWGNYSLNLGNLPDDVYEHNDTLASATELTMDTTYYNLQLYDADVYKVYLTAGQNVSFYFTETGMTGFKAGTVNISLYSTDQATILFKVENLDLDAYSYSYSSASLFTESVSYTGFYYLQITPNQYSCADNYQLQIGRAHDDRYEDNDIVASAAELVKFSYYYLALLDEDYFKIYLESGDSLRVLLTRDGGPGTFGVTIYTPDSQTILNFTTNIEANGVGDISVTSVSNAGYYIIKASSYTGAYGNYTLIIGNVYSTTSPNGIAGFPIEWVLLWGSGILVVIFVTTKRKSIKHQREGV